MTIHLSSSHSMEFANSKGMTVKQILVILRHCRSENGHYTFGVLRQIPQHRSEYSRWSRKQINRLVNLIIDCSTITCIPHCSSFISIISYITRKECKKNHI